MLLCSVPSHTLVSSMPSTHSQSVYKRVQESATTYSVHVCIALLVLTHILFRTYARRLLELQQQYIPYSTVYRLDSKDISYSLTLLRVFPSWLVWAEIECTVHVALSRLPISKSAKQTTGAQSLLS